MKKIPELKIKKPVDPKNPKYYLDKTAMNSALKDYKTACQAAESAGVETPGVPEYVGECFLNIAKGLAMKHNFRNYSFVGDMIGDGVMTCLRYVRSYDPDRLNPITHKPTSALSYFTQCCHFTFLTRIKTEKKQTKVKRALVYSADIDTFSLQHEDEGEFSINMNEFLSSLGTDEVEEFLPKKKPKEEKPGPLEAFL